MTAEPTESGQRSKTITWSDPVPTAAAGARLSGLDYLRAVIAGELPNAPIAAHLNMRPVRAEAGEVSFACTPDESLYNPIGMVHGGVAATLLDSAAACAVHTTLPAGVGYSSVELKVNYVRAIRGDVGELVAHGRVVRAGSRIAFAEAELRDAAGTLLATASTTCLITRP